MVMERSVVNEKLKDIFPHEVTGDLLEDINQYALNNSCDAKDARKIVEAEYERLRIPLK